MARNRYIEAVKTYNVTVRYFPTNMTASMFDFDVKPNFAVQNEEQMSKPPSVDFDTRRRRNRPRRWSPRPNRPAPEQRT